MWTTESVSEWASCLVGYIENGNGCPGPWDWILARPAFPSQRNSLLILLLIERNWIIERKCMQLSLFIKHVASAQEYQDGKDLPYLSSGASHSGGESDSQAGCHHTIRNVLWNMCDNIHGRRSLWIAILLSIWEERARRALHPFLGNTRPGGLHKGGDIWGLEGGGGILQKKGQGHKTSSNSITL